jgi:hypothetical protein
MMMCAPPNRPEESSTEFDVSNRSKDDAIRFIFEKMGESDKTARARKIGESETST